MGKKSKSKTKQKKQAKAALKKAGVKKPSLKQASTLVKKSEKMGIDIGSLVSRGVESIPFVGGVASELLEQTGVTETLSGVTESRTSTGRRGGARGVMLVDTRLGNLGTISRRKALSVLMARGRAKTRPRQKQIAIIRSGEQVVKV